MPHPSAPDFARIAAAALARADELVPQWLARGRRVGREWLCGSLSGEAGDSCRVNLATGAWADFATDDRGGDLISLYAATHNLRPGAAARELARLLGLEVEQRASPRTRAGSSERASAVRSSAAPPSAARAEHGATTEDAAQPAARPTSADVWADAGAWPADGPPAPVAHVVRGRPAASWPYRDAAGAVVGWVHRFVTSTGGKEVLPCVWSRHPTRGLAWRWRAFGAPRPLYARDVLTRLAQRDVLLVEGEKCADAAQRALGTEYAVTTWPGGCKALDKADWSPLAGRRVILWPDCDAKLAKDSALVLPEEQQPGMRAMEAIAQRLLALGCTVHVVSIPAPGARPDGWDVADLVAAAAGRAGEAVRAWLAPDRLRLPRGAAPEPAPPREAAPATVSEARWQDALLWRGRELARHPANVTQILRHDPRWRGVVGFDEFSQVVVKRAPPPYAYARTGEWDSEDDTRASVWLAQQWRLEVSSAQVAEAVEMLARDQRFHPVRDHLRRTAWDGERRCEEWLVRYAGVVDTPYTRAVGTYFLRGMIARIMQPGCKFDFCLVLEGEEGVRKSTLASVLGGAWGSDVPLDLANNREAGLATQGSWVIEFSEMESVTRAEAHLQKSFLSRTFDHVRRVYGRRYERLPRQCVFVGTTNETEYVKEGQGARRFWPVRVPGMIDIDGLRAALPQLLAEALHDHEAGERCYPSPEEQMHVFRPEQMQRVVQESLIDALHDWVLDPELEERGKRASHAGAFSLADAAARCLHVSYAQLTRDLQTRIGKALAALGCERLEKRNGMTRYWYKPPQKVATSHSGWQPAQQPGGGDAGIPRWRDS